MESHDLIDNIERDFFKNDNLSVVIHFDPIVTSEAAVGDLRRWIAGEVKEIDPRLTIHDLRTVPGPTHTNVIFDCVTPPDFGMEPLELKQAIKRRVHAERPELVCVITVEHSFAPMPHG